MDKEKLALDLENVTLGFGPGKGVFNVNLKIKKGTVYGLVGPSGAGKTTLMRIILGFVKQEEGTAKVWGTDVWGNSDITNANTAYIPGEPIIPNEGTGLQYLKFYAGLRHIKDLTKMEELIEYFDLDAKSPIKKMSKGMKQRVAIIAAMMGDYDFYFFDEPTSGLDPVMREQFILSILDLKKQGKTIFISSHMMDEIERTCDEVSILKKGKIEYSGTLDEIKKEGKTLTDKFWEVYNDIESFESRVKKND